LVLGVVTAAASPLVANEAGSVHDPGVYLDVSGPNVETHPSERSEALRARLAWPTNDHEVEMPDPNVIPVHVNLFHGH